MLQSMDKSSVEQTTLSTVYTGQATTQATIICPSKNVTLTIKGYDNQAVQNARVELVELSNGLFYSTTSNSNGVATTQATFGMYRLRIYKDNALVNETSLQVFNDSQQQIRCTLYGIQLSVSVVDFFGSPISNANVTLNGAAKNSQQPLKATESQHLTTSSAATCKSSLKPKAHKTLHQAITVNVNEPTTVQIKLDKYVSVGGMLTQASTLITIIIILVIAVLFVVVEVYRRRKTKPAAPSAT